MLDLTADGSAASLWGRFKTNINDTLNGNNPYSHDGWVGNLEGSIALAYAPYGPRGWDVSLGVRAEDWFGQIDTNTLTASTANANPQKPLSVSGQSEDRWHWGPFMRLKVPFGQ
jgi:hypothetical protein